MIMSLTELPIEFLYKIDVSNLIAMAAMIYFSYSKLSEKIEKNDVKINIKIDKLDEKLTDVDRRLCRLEGAFASKDCCMIKDSNQMKKVK
jgi:hypothetical protein